MEKKDTNADSIMPYLRARESTLIHEWMHVNLVGFPKLCTLTLSNPRHLVTDSGFLVSFTSQGNIADVAASTPLYPTKYVRLAEFFAITIAANHDLMYLVHVCRLAPSRLGLEIYQGGRKRHDW